MNRHKKSTLEIPVTGNCRESELLGDSAKQMNSAINEAFAEIGVLSQLISSMKKNARKLRRTSQNIEQSELSANYRAALAAYSTEIIETASKSQDRMQFADRMHHRLFDVQANLRKLTEISRSREQEVKKGHGWMGLFRDGPLRKNKSINEELYVSTDHRPRV